jgi:hypothetical protein
MTAAKTPRRFPIFYLWPLIGIAAVGVLWAVTAFAAWALARIAETAGSAVYLVYFVVVGPLLFLAPILLLIQLGLLVIWWRRHGRAVA